MNHYSGTGNEALLYRWTDHTPDTLFQARVALRQAAQRYGLSEEAAGDTVMVGAELMANAVEHGRGPYELHLRREQSALLCEVVDHDPSIPDVPSVFPVPTSHQRRTNAGASPPDAVLEQLDERGRGLFIVNEISRGGWGIRTAGQRKIVWCAIPLSK